MKCKNNTNLPRISQLNFRFRNKIQGLCIMILQSQDHILEYFPTIPLLTFFNMYKVRANHPELFNPKSVLQSNLY